MSKFSLSFLLPLAVASCFLASCKKEKELYNGYIEADYIYISPYSNGKIKTIYVSKGEIVRKGNSLFKLDGKKENANVDMCIQGAQGVGYYIENMKKGARPEKLQMWKNLASGIDSLAEGSGIGKDIIGKLEKIHAEAYTKFVFVAHLYGAFTEFSKGLHAWVKYQQLPDRPDKIAAVESLKSFLETQAVYYKWVKEQVIQTAPRDAFVFDVFYREGEFVQAGKPVISLLAPENVKAIFFVDGTVVNKLKYGDKVTVKLSNIEELIKATVNYISPKPEYTDPFIYSLKNNEKYMYLIEAKFDAAESVNLHPGQPIEVDIAMQVN